MKKVVVEGVDFFWGGGAAFSEGQWFVGGTTTTHFLLWRDVVVIV